MLGLGETRQEVLDVLKGLFEAGCEIVTIGQYLQPKREKLEVVEYVHPKVFEEYRLVGEEMGFRAVFSGPFVRSSYMADVVAGEAQSSPPVGTHSNASALRRLIPTRAADALLRVPTTRRLTS